MLVIVVVTMLCAAGVAFDVRFLAALSREREPQSAGYWVRLRLESGETTMAELSEQKKTLSRVA
jgi:hypothetical protein